MTDADVVILFLDRPAETAAAIRSALDQRGVSRRVIVVDQGSRPESVGMIQQVLAGREDAVLLTPGRNLGVAGGRNLGAAAGDARVIAALDNDAEFATPDTLAEMVAALDAAPDLAAIGCRIVRHADGGDDWTSWGYPHALRSRAGERFDTATFVGAGHAIRRDAWDTAGGYDPALFFCWEEFDFALRALIQGWRIAYRGDLVIRHKVAAEHRVDWGAGRWFWQVRNRLYIARKYGSWRAWTRAFAYLAWGWWRGCGGETLRAVAAAWRMPVAGRRRLPSWVTAYLRANDLHWRLIGMLPWRAS